MGKYKENKSTSWKIFKWNIDCVLRAFSSKGWALVLKKEWDDQNILKWCMQFYSLGNCSILWLARASQDPTTECQASATSCEPLDLALFTPWKAVSHEWCLRYPSLLPGPDVAPPAGLQLWELLWPWRGPFHSVPVKHSGLHLTDADLSEALSIIFPFDLDWVSVISNM